jgi:hypothetical protein
MSTVIAELTGVGAASLGGGLFKCAQTSSCWSWRRIYHWCVKAAAQGQFWWALHSRAKVLEVYGPSG